MSFLIEWRVVLAQSLGIPVKLSRPSFGHTGKRNSGYTGLTNYKARFYDPVLGSFLQPDKDVPASQGGGQGLDRYTAMANNPIRYNNPSGHTPVCVLRGTNGCQKWAGLTGVNAAHGFEMVNNDKQANALIVLSKYIQKKKACTTYSWAGLTPVEQDIISAGDWTPNAFSESLNGSASTADFWHNPISYIEIALGSSGLIKTGLGALVSYRATTASVTGESAWQFPSKAVKCQWDYLFFS